MAGNFGLSHFVRQCNCKLPMSVCSLLDLDSGASGLDKWMYYKCQCTSFIAWRIIQKFGIKFHNR